MHLKINPAKLAAAIAPLALTAAIMVPTASAAPVNSGVQGTAPAQPQAVTSSEFTIHNQSRFTFELTRTQAVGDGAFDGPHVGDLLESRWPDGGLSDRWDVDQGSAEFAQYTIARTDHGDPESGSVFFMMSVNPNGIASIACQTTPNGVKAVIQGNDVWLEDA
jgi:hypothetical protein